MGDAERYRRGELLGLGGMGRVVLARDLRLQRDVALKEVGMDADPGMRARLAREAAIAARLDHPGIVPIHDVGRRPDGTVFFAMRVVRGRSLAELAQGTREADRSRLLRAVLAAAEAVGWAHAMGIVHRDLKPANIMIGEFGETQVVDWGLARANDLGPLPELGVVVTDDPAITQVGAIVGTPRYMAPEQARGQVADARSDVWSLGAILFDLVTGRAPYLGESSDDVLAAARRAAVPAIASVAPETPAELAAIIDKALAAEPEGRYPDAKALALDLGRYLDGRRVTAYSYSTWDLVKRVARAWRAPLVVAAIALAAVIAVVTYAFLATEEGRERAEVAELEAREALARADRHLSRALADEAQTHLAEHARPEAELLAAHSLALGESPLARGILASFTGARPERVSESPLAGDCAIPVIGGDGQVRCRTTVSRPLRFVGRKLEARWDAGYLTLLRVGHEPLTLTPCDPTLLGAVAFDEPGERFVVLCHDGRAQLGRLDEGADPTALRTVMTPLVDGGPARMPATTAAWIPLRDQLVVGTTTSKVLLVDLGRGVVLREAVSGVGPVRDLDVSSDGTIAAVLGERGGARLWDLGTGSWLGRMPARWSRQVRFDQESPRDLWTLGPTLARWRLPAVAAPEVWPIDAGVTSLTIEGPDLGVTHGVGVSIFELSTGARRWSSVWPAGVTKSGVFVGETFVASNAGATELRRWDRATGLPSTPVAGDEATRARRVGVLEGPAGPMLVTLAYAPRLVVLHEGHLSELGDGTSFLDLASSADHRTLYALRETPREACRLTAEPQPELGGCIPVPAATALALGPEATLLVTAQAREALVWHAGETTEAASAVPHRVLPKPAEDEGHLTAVALSPDLRYVAAGDRNGSTWVWRLSDAALVMRLHDHAERVSSLAFDQRGRLYTGSWDRTVRRRDLGVLDASPTELVTTLERTWGLGLDELIGLGGR